MRNLAGVVVVGVAFGAALDRIGFTSWDQVHAMFTFGDLRIFLGFAGSVMLLALGWRVVLAIQHPVWAPRRVHPGTIPGAILFGAGWALCGACPSIALAQLGTGQWQAAYALAGIVAGNFAYPFVHARFFSWSPGPCSDV